MSDILDEYKELFGGAVTLEEMAEKKKRIENAIAALQKERQSLSDKIMKTCTHQVMRLERELDYDRYRYYLVCETCGAWPVYGSMDAVHDYLDKHPNCRVIDEL